MAESMSDTVKTLVFMDLETTDLKKYGVIPEITELFMLVVGREQFMSECRVQNKIGLAFNPQQTISKYVSELTGLSADKLCDQERFNAKTIELLNLFLSRLKKPVCMLAHNGKRFDFALLRAELKRVQAELMPDLLCADTLEGFKYIDRLNGNSMAKSPYTLQKIYERKSDKVNGNAHNAEGDVNMMYEIALKDKEDFLIWVDERAIEFNKVSPM